MANLDEELFGLIHLKMFMPCCLQRTGAPLIDTPLYVLQQISTLWLATLIIYGFMYTF